MSYTINGVACVGCGVVWCSGGLRWTEGGGPKHEDKGRGEEQTLNAMGGPRSEKFACIA